MKRFTAVFYSEILMYSFTNSGYNLRPHSSSSHRPLAQHFTHGSLTARRLILIFIFLMSVISPNYLVMENGGGRGDSFPLATPYPCLPKPFRVACSDWSGHSSKSPNTVLSSLCWLDFAPTFKCLLLMERATSEGLRHRKCG